MALPLAKPRLLLADKGYDSDAVREGLLIHGDRRRSSRLRTIRSEPLCLRLRRYQDRNRLERMCNRAQA